MYKVVLDEVNSYIMESETGMSFEDAVNEILEYCRESFYDLQESVWESIQSEGEQTFVNRHQNGANMSIIFT